MLLPATAPAAMLDVKVKDVVVEEEDAMTGLLGAGAKQVFEVLKRVINSVKMVICSSSKYAGDF